MRAPLGSRRHLAGNLCPICDGHAGLVRGRGIRCAGFTLDVVSFCTRDEFAGSLQLDTSLSPPAYKHWLQGNCGCGVSHAIRSGGTPRRSRAFEAHSATAPAGLPIEERDRIYSAALDALPVRREASEELRLRGLTLEDIERFGFRSLPRQGNEHAQFMGAMRERFGDDLLGACPGFVDKNGRLTFWSAWDGRDGYVVPFRDERGRVTGFQAKILGDSYLTARGSTIQDIYVVAGQRTSTLHVTEGGVKAMVASVLGPAWCFGVPGQALQLGHIEAIKRLAPDRVAVALDREQNPTTDLAREKWLQQLAEAGLAVSDSVWEGD